MFDSLKKIFQQTETNITQPFSDLHLFCGLMVEAANFDGVVEEIEVSKITTTLIDIFHEEQELVQKEIDKCLKELNENKSLHFYTSKINKAFSYEKKMLLIETLWKIILADGKIHDFESSLIRRLAGLLYLSDFDCGQLKNKVLNNN